jgi:hypothetical protein
MSNRPPAPNSPRFRPNTSFPRDLFSLDSWAVAAAVAFIVLVVAGILPRISW